VSRLKHHVDPYKFPAGPRAIYGIPHEYTYGSHVYDKGSDVVHTLRWYMGDTDFKKAIHSIMENNSMNTINTIQFRDSLQKYTSRDMTSFFENWIFTPGFPHLAIQSQEIVEDGSNFKVNLMVEQRTKFTWEQYKSIPIEIAFYSSVGKVEYRDYEMKQYGNPITFTLPFLPQLIIVDPNEKVSDAITDEMTKVQGSAVIDFKDALMKLTINSSADTSLIRVEHHWISPKRTDNTPALPFLSKERYWTVDGIFSQDLNMDARIAYDGRTPSSGSYGYLDNKLIISSEDNLVLLYRENESAEWKEFPNYSKLTGTKTDGFGYVDIKGLVKGQYAFGFNDETLGGNSISTTEQKLIIYPNPSKNKEVTVYFPFLDTSGTITVLDIKGQVIYKRSLKYSQNKEIIKTANFAKGTYFVEVTSKENSWKSKLIIK
jgi:aminopeptidase N